MPPQTRIETDPVSVAPVSYRTVTDDNVLQALEERWELPPKTKSSTVYTREPRNLYEKLVFPILRDPRDLPVFNLALKATLTVVPSALNLLFGHATWYFAILHAALVISQIEIYVLALHVSSHRPIFKAGWPSFLNNFWLPGLLAPFMGHTWGTYYWHHVKMHHVTDNGPDDLSTTLLYQRDSLPGFVHYFLNFYALTWFQLGRYFIRQNRPLVTFFVFGGELAWFVLTYLYLTAYPHASVLGIVTAIILPLNGMRFGMMQGNWVQHAFLERTDPLGGGMKNSITVISCPYNVTCFNDGYHASHHVNPIRHWTEHPAELVRDRQKYHDDGAIVFHSVNYGQIWTMLMKKDYTKLAGYWVHMGTESQRPKDLKEIEDLLKEKTKRFESFAEVEKIYTKEK